MTTMSELCTQLERIPSVRKRKTMKAKTTTKNTTSVFDVNRIWMSFFFVLVLACPTAATLRAKLHSFHVVENMLQKEKNVRYVFFTHLHSLSLKLNCEHCVLNRQTHTHPKAFTHGAHTIEPAERLRESSCITKFSLFGTSRSVLPIAFFQPHRLKASLKSALLDSFPKWSTHVSVSFRLQHLPLCVHTIVILHAQSSK